MGHHEILAPALQKYYSALKSFCDFGQHGDFFDDISNLDKFFSEFRNVTFVIQKGLKTKENKAIYEKLRSEHLSGDTLKWFVEKRNQTTKEKPFDLKKELCIDLYLPGKIVTLTDTRLVVDVEGSFNDALKYIRSTFFDKFNLLEVYFTSRVIFRESGHEIDLCSKIKCGISQMNNFIKAMTAQFPCDCRYCTELREKITDLYVKVRSKELAFISDYSLEIGKGPCMGDKVEMYISTDKNEQFAFSDLRLPLDNPIFKEAQGCFINLFLSFASMHTAIFQMQKHKIMPVFMLVYRDQTYRMAPFVATSKATFYRKIMELIAIPDFDEVDAVFYCGEYYTYGPDQFETINEKPYSERTVMAQTEELAFVMLTRENFEMSLTLDEKRIDDMKYVAQQFKQVEREKSQPSSFDWLNPIRQKLSAKKVR